MIDTDNGLGDLIDIGMDIGASVAGTAGGGSSSGLLSQIISSATQTGLAIAKSKYGTVPGIYQYNAKTGSYYSVVGDPNQTSITAPGLVASMGSESVNTLFTWGLVAAAVLLGVTLIRR